MTEAEPVTVGTAVDRVHRAARRRSARVQRVVRARPLLCRRDGRTRRVRRRPVGRDARVQGRASGPHIVRRSRARLVPRRPTGCCPDRQAEWDEWAAREYAATPPDRLFAGRDHIHTAVYRFAHDARADDAPVPATALDHGFAGVIAVATTGEASPVTEALLGPDLPLALAFDPERTILTTTEPNPHRLVLGFSRDRSAAGVGTRRTGAGRPARCRVREPVPAHDPRHRRVRRRTVTRRIVGR